MKKFLVPFAIGAGVALAVQFFQKNAEPVSPKTDNTAVEAAPAASSEETKPTQP